MKKIMCTLCMYTMREEKGNHRAARSQADGHSERAFWSTRRCERRSQAILTGRRAGLLGRVHCPRTHTHKQQNTHTHTHTIFKIRTHGMLIMPGDRLKRPLIIAVNKGNERNEWKRTKPIFLWNCDHVSPTKVSTRPAHRQHIGGTSPAAWTPQIERQTIGHTIQWRWMKMKEDDKKMKCRRRWSECLMTVRRA